MSKQRLFGIVYHLVNSGKTTSAELAKLFEVSTRTIRRDINTLSSAGIPVYTETGRNGGIYLLDNFVLDKVLLSKEEQDNLLLAAKSIRKINPQVSDQTFSKLQSLFNSSFDNWLEVDLTTWNQSTSSNKQFDLLKSSILEKRQLELRYANSKGQVRKRICNPVKLVFKSQAWYLQAFCLESNAFRVFKISRMISVKLLDQTYFPIAVPEIPEYHSNIETIFLRLVFSKEILYRVYDEFDHKDILPQHDGTVILETNLPDEEWVPRYLLSFGKHLKVLSPASIKQKMMLELQEVLSAL